MQVDFNHTIDSNDNGGDDGGFGKEMDSSISLPNPLSSPPLLLESMDPLKELSETSKRIRVLYY